MSILLFVCICRLIVADNANAYSNTVIPVIDLRQTEETIISKLYSAATQYGFFYLIGHNISFEVKNKLFSEMKLLFNLDDSIKNQLLYVPGTNFGYTPFEAETLNKTLSNYGDQKEGYYICDDYIQYNEDNGWSYKNIWPPNDLLPEFKQSAINYFHAMKHLGYKMNEYVALSLNLSRNYLNQDQIFGDNPLPVLRMLHYFPIISDIEIGRFAAGQHTDYGMMTFLVTDGKQGLQILHNEQWIDVEELNGAIVVNIGDELEMSTNDHFLSSKHRVVMREALDRYSAAFFWEPSLDHIVKCVETICGENAKETPKYEPITHRDHLTKKFSAAYGTVNNAIWKDEL